MAKVLENLALFVKGDPGEAEPTSGYFSYDVVDGDLRKDGQIYDLESPTWTDSPNTIWTAAVTAIKTAEGIS